MADAYAKKLTKQLTDLDLDCAYIQSELQSRLRECEAAVADFHSKQHRNHQEQFDCFEATRARLQQVAAVFDDMMFSLSQCVEQHEPEKRQQLSTSTSLPNWPPQQPVTVAANGGEPTTHTPSQSRHSVTAASSSRPISTQVDSLADVVSNKLSEASNPVVLDSQVCPPRAVIHTEDILSSISVFREPTALTGRCGHVQVTHVDSPKSFWVQYSPARAYDFGHEVQDGQKQLIAQGELGQAVTKL